MSTMQTVTGTFVIGLSINGVTHKDFEMREASVGDMFDAESETDVSRPLAFNGQMMIRQLVRVGDFKGPFTIGMIRGLHPADYRTLRAKQMELDALGESEGGEG